MPVAKKILEVMKQVDYLQMDKKLQGGLRYAYLSEEKVTGEIHDKAVAVGLIVIPTSMEISQSADISTKEGTTHNVRILAGYSWIDPEDDSQIEARVMGEASDVGDKALPKAMTNAYKNLMLQTFMISRGQGEESEGGESFGNSCEGLLENGDPCKAFLTQAQAEYSIRTFKRRLCLECQKRHLNGRPVRGRQSVVGGEPAVAATTNGPAREVLLASVNAGFTQLAWLKSKQVKFIYDATDQRRGSLDACTDAELGDLAEKVESIWAEAVAAEAEGSASAEASTASSGDEAEVEDPFK